jgi:hypothetical protein
MPPEAGAFFPTDTVEKGRSSHVWLPAVFKQTLLPSCIRTRCLPYGRKPAEKSLWSFGSTAYLLTLLFISLSNSSHVA